LAVGVWEKLEDVAASWKEDRIFEPAMKKAKKADLKRGWQEALARSRSKIPA
jgi:glycerol kinase